MTGGARPRQPPQGVPSPPGESIPPPPSPSPSVPALIGVSHRLTGRDLHLARLLAEHRTLTTGQITAILFAHPGTARNRLRQLREIGFLDRFAHRTPAGRRVTCWVPGLLAARYIALADGLPAPTPRAVRQVQDRTLANPQLDHLLGVNQFFTDLLVHARTHPSTRLARWWSAEHTANAFAGRIHPDGHGLWETEDSAAPPTQAPPPGTADDVVPLAGGFDREGSGTWVATGFWLEHDTGTEPLTRVVAKLGPYQRFQQAGGPTYPVLFRLPTRRREANLHRLIAAHLMPHVAVATSVPGDGAGPAGAVWWPATHVLAPPEQQTTVPDDARVRLQELPAVRRTRVR
jgi:hypothetical protein